jgi:outer membrane protein OmpA-like peptidoglycan-associated protein
MVDRWISYRTFWFDSNTVGLRGSDSNQVSEIAYYMKQNPSLKLGIDGSIPGGSGPSNLDLAGRRVSTVYWALVNAGVPNSRMETGAFGDPQLARDGRVEVLLRTSDYTSK